MTLGTLCSGIGLMDLGLERAGLGPVRWQCEVLPERRAVLAHHWPGVRRYDDVQTMPTPEWVDCIAFGSPCKNLSSAGDRTGLDGASSRLFWDCLRIVQEVHPRWVIFENVASGGSLWVDRVRSTLEQLGYKTLPVPLAASDCGAPHRRARVFIVAYTDQHGGGPRRTRGTAACREVEQHHQARPPSTNPNVVVRNESGRGSRQDGAGAAVIANDGDVDSEGEYAVSVDAETPRLRGVSTDLDGARSEGDRPVAHEGRTGPAPDAWRAPVPDLLRVVHGGAARMDGARQRISALGDSCTPQQAEVIGHIVRLLDR